MKITLHLILWASCFILICGIIDGIKQNTETWIISIYFIGLISGLLRINKDFNEKSN